MEGSTVSADRRRLFLASFLMLFVELVLIRWLGAHIAYLSFFSNFVLLGSFLGIGIGFLAVSRSDWFRRAPIWLGALVFMSAVFPVTIDRSGSGLIFFGGFQARGLPIWISLPIVFAAVAATMAAIAQGVARLFQRFPPLEAYRLDVLGSVTGIAGFATLSFIGAPPVPSGGPSSLGCSCFSSDHPSGSNTPLRLASSSALSQWRRSPTPWCGPPTTGSPGRRPTRGRKWSSTGSLIRPSQRPKHVGPRIPRISCPTSGRLCEPPERVLVIGAGTGADVAIALAEGVGQVDAVEIDPELYELGRRVNPERPYEDPRVRVIIDDGRAFLERSIATT